MFSDEEGLLQTNARAEISCVARRTRDVFKGLLRNRTGVEDIENQLGETRLRWLGPGRMKRGRSKKSWDKVVKKNMKNSGLSISDVDDRNKRRRCYKRIVSPD